MIPYLESDSPPALLTAGYALLRLHVRTRLDTQSPRPLTTRGLNAICGRIETHAAFLNRPDLYDTFVRPKQRRRFDAFDCTWRQEILIYRALSLQDDVSGKTPAVCFALSCMFSDWRRHEAFPVVLAHAPLWN